MIRDFDPNSGALMKIILYVVCERPSGTYFGLDSSSGSSGAAWT